MYSKTNTNTIKGMMSDDPLDGIFTIDDSDDEEEEEDLDDVEIGDDRQEPVDRDDTVSNSQTPARGCKKRNILAASLIMTAAVALGVGLSLGHTGSNEGSSQSAIVVEPNEETAGSEVRAYISPVGDGTSTNETKEKEKAQYYTSDPDDPIPVTLRLISPSIMSGYEQGEAGCTDLVADIYNASAIIANEAIKSNARYYDWDDEMYMYSRAPRGESASGDGSLNRAAANGESAKGNKEDSYETNNQETGVDEADIMKSDGKHVFTAYGDILVVWNAKTGKEVSRTKMPPRETLSEKEGGYHYYYNRKPSISGLLLDSTSNRIVVIASGYSPRYRYDFLDQPALSEKGDTRVFLYDLESMPIDGSELSLLSSQEMDGEYCSARKINGVAHVVLQSSVQTYRHISYRLSRWRDEYDKARTKEEYIALATENAKRLLDDFSNRFMMELRATSGGKDCAAVTRLALYASGGDDNNKDGFPEAIARDVLDSYLQVSSFDISAAPVDKRLTLNAKTAGSFFPSSTSEIYASKDVLIAAGRGYHRDAATRSWSQSTYFLSFKLKDDGSAPSGLAVGSAPGYVLNQFSMDEYKGYFRVATTERARWGCMPTDQMLSRRSFWHFCNWERISESKSQLIVMKFPEDDGSGSPQEMKTIKVIDNLGVTEEIKSARFFDDKAYIVTFMQTDPLYTIDFRDPENPKVTDELKISGFSSYLHPVGNDRLLAIGKEADERTGRVTGFQISLFDVENLKNTKLLQRYTINERWASSSAERDHLAFRYLPLSKLLILPISIRPSWRWWDRDSEKQDSFDGFKVYYVGDDKIEKRFGISMTSSSRMEYGCWYDAYLPARSMVFNGDLMVAKGHGYVSYDLDTEKRRWRRNLDKNVPKNKCSSYWLR